MTTPKTPIILASSSRWRREALQRLGVAFSCQSPNIDEQPRQAEPCQALAARLAREKMRAISSKNLDHVVIGSDQVACLQGAPVPKPTTLETVHQQLRQQSGQTVTFYTAVCVGQGSKMAEYCDITQVTFKTLRDRQIGNYLKREQPLGCAGGFQVEGFGVALFEQINSSDPSALVGLPLLKLASLLNEFGIDPLA